MKQEFNNIRRFPYNSFGKIYLAEHREYPQKFGGNCVFLTQQLTRALIQSGFTPQVISASNRSHWAVVCREGKKTYQLDPFLLHEEPIPISQILHCGQTSVYDALPIVDGNPSKLQVVPRSLHEFTVTLLGFRAGQYESIRKYDYDLRSTLPAIPENWEQKRDNQESTYLTMRTLDPQGDVTSLYLYEEGFMSAKIFGKKKLKQRSDLEFYDVISRVSSQLQTNVDRLMRFFYDAQNIYRERASRAQKVS